MLSRSSAIIISLTSLGVGIILGFSSPAADRRFSPRFHQRSETRIATLRTSADATVSDHDQSVDSLYDALAKQYEQFEHVNRTFELVAKAVSPALVHIVAHKTSRREDEQPSRASF